MGELIIFLSLAVFLGSGMTLLTSKFGGMYEEMAKEDLRRFREQREIAEKAARYEGTELGIPVNQFEERINKSYYCENLKCDRVGVRLYEVFECLKYGVVLPGGHQLFCSSTKELRFFYESE